MSRLTRAFAGWRRPCRTLAALAVGGFRLPEQFTCRPTLKRRLNLCVNRWEHALRRTRLLSYPWMLSIEPTNRCNLRCPFCFTGAGGLGRPSSFMTLDRYRRLLDEIGDYLILLKVHGWGEPLLCKHLDGMLRAASARGIHTIVNSNLSLPFDEEKAERLVASGLNELVVSIDGAQQGTYERYRIGGSLARVLENIRVANAAKQRLGSDSPRLIIEFHPFPWNTQDVAAIRALAEELRVSLTLYKGCMPGGEWDDGGRWKFCLEPSTVACSALWTLAVVAADGGVAPCNGTFYREDDMGRIDPSSLEGMGFRSVWNNERYQLARRFFRARKGSEEERNHVCFDCPSTVLWDRWRRHLEAGLDPAAFAIDITTSDVWNYFWNRQPAYAARAHADGRDVVKTSSAG